MVSKTYGKKAIILFFITVICLSAGAEVLICGFDWSYGYPILMWIPAFAALIGVLVSFQEQKEAWTLKKHLSMSGFRFCKIRYIIAGIVIPFVYLWIPYQIYWGMHPENFAYNGVPVGLILQDCLLPCVIGIFFSLLTAAGEEIGWRGFLVPALKERLGLEKTLVVTGLFWCLWHFPLLIWGGYMEGPSLLYSLIAFVLCIFPVGVICGLLRIESGSMWPCAFLHAAHNNYDQMIFGVITRGEDRMYYVSETGIFTIICVWLIAGGMYFYYKKKAA